MPAGPSITKSDGTIRRGEIVPAGPGFHFAVGELDLNSIDVTYQVTLAFEGVAVVIESPFSLTLDGISHELDPGDRSHLDPLFAVYPNTLASLDADGESTLTVRFASGAIIAVVNDEPPYEPWHVSGPRNVTCGVATGASTRPVHSGVTASAFTTTHRQRATVTPRSRDLRSRRARSVGQ